MCGNSVHVLYTQYPSPLRRRPGWPRHMNHRCGEFLPIPILYRYRSARAPRKRGARRRLACTVRVACTRSRDAATVESYERGDWSPRRKFHGATSPTDLRDPTGRSGLSHPRDLGCTPSTRPPRPPRFCSAQTTREHASRAPRDQPEAGPQPGRSVQEVVDDRGRSRDSSRGRTLAGEGVSRGASANFLSCNWWGCVA